MSVPGPTCFDASGYAVIPFGTLLAYKTQWSIFDRIFQYDVNVSTVKGTTGNKTLPYYTYLTIAEKNDYLNGQMLHINRYPNSNWNVNRD